MSLTFRKSLIVGAVVLIVGLIAIWWWHSAIDSQGSRQRNAQYTELLELSGQLNRDLPRLLDRQTRFERAEVVNYGMRFYYSLVSVDRFTHDEAALAEQVEPQLREAYCNDDNLAFYRERADFIEFQYLDQNELKIFHFRFSPDDCRTD
ncbi:MAG: hypothetical protein CMF22_08515 [Idiomarinaceae bacterium]|uniref:Uncharacterized protein n=1 Tax=Pseudidiomarina aquimaris TaxID=641841 RepID=A0A432XQ63_9GAMM|nr:hypothetical protein [Pseudidiomarina aquimaris]MBG23484.1 hypothetical protein [Idiomarinaceae bacterium]RUO50761.1 hypothetical protein CWE21_01255 [Pseudidiomarina aquimaris]|tara:strand:+ start:12 stop:458 length:447 start_codon:yes stop_codon:yes gene_type:complete